MQVVIDVKLTDRLGSDSYNVHLPQNEGREATGRWLICIRNVGPLIYINNESVEQQNRVLGHPSAHTEA
jgi:hypothetical protein